MGDFSYEFVYWTLTKWPNTLKQFVGKFSTNCLSVFGHFINLALKGLSENINLQGQIFYVSTKAMENTLTVLIYKGHAKGTII